MASRRGPDNSARITISGSVNTKAWANVFHVQFTTSSAIAQADLDSWLNTFQANYKTRFAARMSSSVLFEAAQVVVYTPGGGELISVMAMSGAGTGSSSGLETNSACAVISWQSGVYWRGGKPRTYIPLPQTGEISSGYLYNSTGVTNLKAGASSFRTDTNAQAVGTITTTALGFISYRSGNADRIPPIFFPITGSTVHGRLGTQRRRLGKPLA